MTQTAADQLHRRRAIGYLVLSALLPGSVQRLAGNRRVGTQALRTLGIVVGLVLLVGLLALVVPGFVVGILLTPWVTVLLKVVAWALFIGWAALLFDSWRLARPMEFPQRTRLTMTIVVGVLVIAVGVLTNAVTNAFTAAGNVGQVLPGGGETEDHHGRYNVLLLGVDAADDRIGIRPDSINVASVDDQTGRTVLFGLPRNMQKVPFPEGSPMHGVYPQGFQCPDNECMLNAVWTAGEEHAQLFPDEADAGLEATKAAVSETLGIELNYYALVDMTGFSSIIDAMGGITLDVMKPIPIGGGGSPVSGYIEPGEDVHLDGRHALWFARSRHGASDYERMQRQKCVMSAMVGQLDPSTVATRFVELSEAGKNLLRTDVPRDQIVSLAALALKARDHDIAAVNFTPPLIPNTADPEFGVIRDIVQQRIAAAEAADEAEAAAASASPSPSSAPSATEASPSPAPTSASASATPSASPSESAEAEDPATPSDPGDPEAYTGELTTDALGTVCSAG